MLDAVEVVHDHASRHVCSAFSISGDHAKIKFESIGERGDPLRAARVLRDDDRLAPVWDIMSNPLCNNGFGMQIVDRTLEEALHL